MIKILNRNNRQKLKDLHYDFSWAVAVLHQSGNKKTFYNKCHLNAKRLLIQFINSLAFPQNLNISSKVESNLKRLFKMVTSYDKLQKTIAIIEKYLSKNLNNNEIKNLKDYLKENVFNWNKFRKKTYKWDKISNAEIIKKIINVLGLEVCPYCNRNYISCFLNKNKVTVIPTIDHFYEKSLYPYLALSLYNLIPSCDYCNTKLKNTLDTYNTPILNPYQEGFEDNVRFELELFKDSKVDLNNIKIRLVIKNDYDNRNKKIKKDKEEYLNKCINTNRELAITNIYNTCHQELAKDIYNRCKLYNGIAYIDSMKKILGVNSDNAYGFTPETLLFGNCLNSENDLKEPLSKFKRDIINEFINSNANKNKDYVPLSDIEKVLNKQSSIKTRKKK